MHSHPVVTAKRTAIAPAAGVTTSNDRGACRTIPKHPVLTTSFKETTVPNPNNERMTAVRKIMLIMEKLDREDQRRVWESAGLLLDLDGPGDDEVDEA
mgnify:CR=1 FL=1